MADGASGAEQKTEKISKEEFLQRQAEELGQLRTRAAQLDAQVREHVSAGEVLVELPKDRRAFRLVGDVLVEQTVGEVLTSVTEQKKLIANTLETTVKRSLQIEEQVREISQAS